MLTISLTFIFQIIIPITISFILIVFGLIKIFQRDSRYDYYLEEGKIDSNNISNGNLLVILGSILLLTLIIVQNIDNENNNHIIPIAETNNTLQKILHKQQISQCFDKNNLITTSQYYLLSPNNEIPILINNKDTNASREH